MKRLYLLRHAKSSWSEPTLDDRDRPLARRGEKAAKRLARHLERAGIRPALVLCSSAKRTRETLERLEAALGKGVRIEIEDALYAASAEELLARLRRVPDTVPSVLLIGHNPGLEELARLLARGGADRQRLEKKFPTGALATLELRRLTWSGLQPGDGELVDFAVPREL